MDLCEVNLLASIKSKKWTELLPPLRDLARTLGVSPPTLRQALLRLAGKGVLIARGERRRYGISNSTGFAKPKKTAPVQKRLLIITYDGLEKIPDSPRKIIGEVEREMRELGWSVAYAIIDYFHAKTPAKSWDTKLLANQKPDAILATYRRPVLGTWAAQHHIPTYFLGGRFGEGDTTVAVMSRPMLANALEKLIALGHTRIFTPLCDLLPDSVESYSSVYKEVFEKAGIAFQSKLHTPFSQYASPEVLMRMAEESLCVLKPTAVVLLEWRQFFTLISLFARLGIRIPEDISVCVLHPLEISEWFVPKIAHFSYPDKKIANNLVRMITGSSPTKLGLVQFTPVWVQGGSMATARD